MPDVDPRTPQERFLESKTLEDIRRRAVAREVTERQRLSQEQEESNWLADAIKIGTLGAAAWFLGRSVIADDFVLRGIHKTGQFGKRAVGQPASKLYRGLVDELIGKPVEHSARQSIELLEDLSQSQHLIKQLEASTGRAYGSGNVAHQQEIIQSVRKGISDKGYDNLEREGLAQLRPATVGDVLRDVSLQRQIGESHFKTLKEASEIGLIGKKTALTRGYGGLFIDTSTKSIPGFVDTRFIKPTHIARGAYNVLSNLKIPFTGFRPVDLIANVVRPFTEGDFAGMVGSDLNVAKGVRTGPGLNYVVGGRLYTQIQGGAFEEAATNIRLHRISGVGNARIERYNDMAEKMAPRLAKRIRRGEATKREQVEWATGVGRNFRTKESVLVDLWEALKRRDAVVTKEADVVPREFVTRKSTLGVGEPTVARRAGRKQFELAQIEHGSHPSQVGKPEGYDVAGEAVSNVPLTRGERFKAYFGLSERADVRRPSRAVDEPVEKTLIPPKDELESFGVSSKQGRRQVIHGEEPIRPSKTGEVPDKIADATAPVEFYASRGTGATLKERVEGTAEALVDVGYFMTSRLNDLLGWTAGIGFKPVKGEGILGGIGATAGNAAKLYGVYTGFHAALGYANYADYLFETTLGRALPEGYDSPKNLAVRMYQGFQLARAYVRDAIGITAGSQYTEDLHPGIIDSGASWTARTVAPVVAGAMWKGKIGALGGIAASLLIGGNDVTESAKDTLDTFKGDKLVPVRKSRWWMLGRQPFEGGQISHYAPHWTRRTLADYRFTDTQYGDKTEYYSRVSRLPTFNNFFGLTNLFQDGGPVFGGDTYLAKKHRETRPYPNTPGVDYEEALKLSQVLASRGPHDAPLGAGQRLGYESTGQGVPIAEEGIQGGVRRFTDRISELGGIYKFLFSDLFSKDDTPDLELARYESIGSTAREYYDASLGGLMGMSELYRRFVPSQMAKPGFNPVPNSMPDWLPGVRSRFQGDRSQPNRFDYTLGDPYAKVQQGEMRLPGSSYETLHRLHSGAPGVYDAMDRFLILGDVAPSSEAYKHYRSIVENWQKTGVLDASWSEKFETTKKQVKAKLQRYEFSHRRFTGMITDPNPEETSEKYNALEKMSGAVWEVLTHDLVPMIGDTIPIVGPALAEKGLQQLSPIEHYLRYQVRGEEFADWRDPMKAFVRHKYENAAARDPISATGVGAVAGYLMGSNPISGALMGTVSAGIFGGGSFIKNITSEEVPEFRQREYELREWFDNFQYVKSRVLETRAMAAGDQQLASYYQEQKRRTVTGLNYADPSAWGFTANALKAMDRNNRGYFTEFLNMPGEAQRQISGYMPRNLQPVMARATQQGEKIFEGYRKFARMSADTRAAMFFSQAGGMPKSSWAGWHPDVSMDAVKIKFIDSGANSVSADIHKFDLFSEHRMRAAPYDNLSMPVGDLEGVQLDPEYAMDLQKQLLDAGFQNVRFSYESGPQFGVQWDVQNNTMDAIRQAIHEVLR